MCLARVYLKNQEDRPALQDVVRMRVYDDRVEMETLFGLEKAVPGKVVEVDFVESKILLESGC